MYLDKGRCSLQVRIEHSCSQEDDCNCSVRRLVCSWGAAALRKHSCLVKVSFMQMWLWAASQQRSPRIQAAKKNIVSCATLGVVDNGRCPRTLQFTTVEPFDLLCPAKPPALRTSPILCCHGHPKDFPDSNSTVHFTGATAGSIKGNLISLVHLGEVKW